MQARILEESDRVFLVHLESILVLCEKCASHPAMDPIPMIDRILLLIKRTQLCAAGDWETGCGILWVCKVLLKHHRKSVLLARLGDLLSEIADKFADVDVCDLGM